MTSRQDNQTAEHPATIGACRRSNCFAPETPCNLGSELSECPHFGANSRSAPQAQGSGEGGQPSVPADVDGARTLIRSQSESDGVPLPWTGNSLGTLDLQFLAARSNPRVLGIVGNQNSGKTTLLTVLYLLLHAGHFPAKRQFGGSFTLGGWEALAHHLRWSAGQAPSFPPHTPRGPRRMPGLLHLVFRPSIADGQDSSTDIVEDVLLTDPPGEWFGAWAIDRDAPAAEGARWIANNSDAFVLLVDSEALAGSERGSAREQVLRLSHRLSECRRHSRVAVVWTKADIPVREGIRAAICAAFDKDLPGHRSFSVQVPLLRSSQSGASGSLNIDADTVQTFIQLLTWLLDSPRSLVRSGSLQNLAGELRHLTTNAGDPFLAYSSP